jgi:hypothetical protein
MPDALARGLPRGSVSGSRTKKLADPLHRTPAPLSPPAHLRLPPTPALVAHAQGGLTLSLEEGELDADFCQLGKSADARVDAMFSTQKSQ